VHEIERTFANGCERPGFRLVHYSLQGNHAHLIVEADDPGSLGRGMKAIGARLARAVNRIARRTGRVLADRYHMRLLSTPKEVRNALRYVLLNARRHAARGATWGRIIGLTSGGTLGFPEEVSYGAAKAAQENYTMSAAAELAPLGITANMVHPPVTDTGWVTDGVREFVAGSRHLTHVATPDEVAQVIAYLASEAAGLVSGNVIHLR